ncbi:hypothetical protein ACJIZ3_019218 [Penstemon smallii]|uniref:Uncharacterized protein n=1 Tax=Penstemon smallii TaxID=265156 RepID=A0ABD3T194_9LAMI
MAKVTQLFRGVLPKSSQFNQLRFLCSQPSPITSMGENLIRPPNRRIDKPTSPRIRELEKHICLGTQTNTNKFAKAEMQWMKLEMKKLTKMMELLMKPKKNQGRIQNLRVKEDELYKLFVIFFLPSLFSLFLVMSEGRLASDPNKDDLERIRVTPDPNPNSKNINWTQIRSNILGSSQVLSNSDPKKI